jgi:pantetheine-phosphate adenylyltransferase
MIRRCLSTASNTLRRAVYAGTFDPPSEGHKDIIQRARSVCDVLYVAVAANPDKKHHYFTVQERVQLLQTIADQLQSTQQPNDDVHTSAKIHVVDFSGLVVEFAEQNDCSFLIRGLRAYSDFEGEFRMALVNRQISGLETLFLMANEAQTHISSSLIRQLGVLGEERLKRLEFVPPEIQDLVFERIREKYSKGS